MQVDFSFICDHADASGAGKLHALGIGIDTLFVPELPGSSQFHFVAVLAASAAEVGTKQIEIKLLGPDGQELVATGGPVVIGPPPIPGQPSRARIAMQFAGIAWPEYGVYGVHLLVNGQEMTAVQIMVLQTPQPTSA